MTEQRLRRPRAQGGRARCQRVCTNSCPRAKNKRCDDGGPNDPGPDYRPLCSLGSDCSDCGSRYICAPHQTNLRLPRHAIERRPDITPLASTEILFMIMGSSRYKQRSLRAHRTWCSQPHKLKCIFFSDEAEGAAETAAASGVPLVQVRAEPPRRNCCPPGSTSIFCDKHRSTTLPAQYRFLPALRYVWASKAFAARRFRWIASRSKTLPTLSVTAPSASPGPSEGSARSHCDPRAPPAQLGGSPWSEQLASGWPKAERSSPSTTRLAVVDDDSFVFVAHLRWLLSKLDDSQPLYLGDFGSTTEAVQLHVPRFACGGGGSLLSAEPLVERAVRPARRHRPVRPSGSKGPGRSYASGGAATAARKLAGASAAARLRPSQSCGGSTFHRFHFRAGRPRRCAAWTSTRALSSTTRSACRATG